MNLATLLLTALALTVVGCASVCPGDAAPDLVGPTWHLVSIGGNAPLASGATLTFAADGRVSGSTRCNRFSGTYEWEHDGDLELSPLATTRMACPPDAMEQERRLLAALADIERAEVEGDRLVLLDDEGGRLLTFTSVPVASSTATLTGSVTYLPRIALPPDAVVSVRLLDVSGTSSEVVAEETAPAEGRSVPIPFSLAYDTGDVNLDGRYVVRADVRDRLGALLWTTNTAVPVLTGGAPSSGVEVRVMQVTDAEVGQTVGALIGPTWRVHQIDEPGEGVRTLGWRAPYTLRFEADSRYGGQVDCNRVSGGFEAHDDGSLILEPGPTTLAACPEGSASDAVLRVLARVDRYTVGGDRLDLIGGAGSLVLVRDDGFGNPGEANTGAFPGPEWALAEIRSASGAATVPQGEGRFTVSFLGDGRFTGRADCNRYGGSFEANSDGELVLTNTSTTVAACAPPSSSRAFFGVLNQVVGFEVPAGRLTLRGADGSALMFEREAGWMEPQGTLRDYVYRCESPDGPFTFRIRTGPGEIALWLPPRFEGREGGTYLVLGQVVSASGAKYQDGPVTVWTKGQDYALLEVDGHEFLACPAQH